MKFDYFLLHDDLSGHTSVPRHNGWGFLDNTRLFITDRLITLGYQLKNIHFNRTSHKAAAAAGSGQHKQKIPVF